MASNAVDDTDKTSAEACLASALPTEANGRGGKVPYESVPRLGKVGDPYRKPENPYASDLHRGDGTAQYPSYLPWENDPEILSHYHEVYVSFDVQDHIVECSVFIVIKICLVAVNFLVQFYATSSLGYCSRNATSHDRLM